MGVLAPPTRDCPARRLGARVSLTASQRSFLALYVWRATRIIKSWWTLQGKQLHAECECGTSVTLTLREWVALVDGGFVEAVGIAGVRVLDEAKGALVTA